MLSLLLRVLIIVVALLLSGPRDGRSQALVDLQNVRPQSIASAGFSLPSAATVQIEAVGAEWPEKSLWSWSDRKPYWAGNAWILDARSRDVVWELRSASTRSRGDLRAFEGSLRLPAGTYEAYYASYPATNWNVSNYEDRAKVHPKGEFVQVSDRNGRRYVTVYGGPLLESGAYKQFELVVRGPGQRADADVLRKVRQNRRSDAFISFTDVEPTSYKNVGFELSRSTEFDIYAVGEAREDAAFDYGWIINADTRERVWSMHFDQSDHAGGAEKNRSVRTRITLPAGRYAAFYSMDDSHHPGEWNSVPPHDPEFWGMMMSPVGPPQKFEVFDYDIAPSGKPIVELTRVRDDETRAQKFALTRPLDVRIFAVGEGREGKMADYGWILDARSRRPVWEMSHRRTEHAGGDTKNRLADETIRLEAGEYVAYYATDGSHSHDDWNASPPMLGDYWGLTILPASEPVPNGVVRLMEDRRDASVLAAAVHVRDGEHRRERFTLASDADVRIYALGEGDDGHMHDYGWIEEARTGRTVWEMTYRMTDHAGGASKNRALDTTIRLAAGEYEVHYVTDGSHSFNDWNASRPTDPQAWGITVYRSDQ